MEFSPAVALPPRPRVVWSKLIPRVGVVVRAEASVGLPTSQPRHIQLPPTILFSSFFGATSSHVARFRHRSSSTKLLVPVLIHRGLQFLPCPSLLSFDCAQETDRKTSLVRRNNCKDHFRLCAQGPCKPNIPCLGRNLSGAKSQDIPTSRGHFLGVAV